jgi:peptidoglycan/xylan/chitin deacetylase (PgdA/CDA1 family)
MKPLASLSLDLDNEWSYLKTHGDPAWESLPSYLDVAVPRALDLLGSLDLTITFFVVGQDADLDRNHDAIASLSRAGHEIGNHSFHHEPWLHRYSIEQVREELSRTEDALAALTGSVPVGFRGPGYSLSPTVLEVLVERGYLYDASTLPTVIGPLARAFYFRSAKLDARQREERAGLFGSATEALRPLTPYRWDVGADGLVEIPVTTLPGLRIPFHVSYLLYLAGRSPVLARSYFRTALLTCHSTHVAPSILLHPLDILGADDVGSLSFFPGMAMSGKQKRALVAGFLALLAERFEVCTVGEHAAAVAGSPLPMVTPGSRRPPRAPKGTIEVAGSRR